MTTLALCNPKPWRPTPFLWLSVVVHVIALLAVVVDRSLWPWALGALVSIHLAITAAGLLPRCAWLGETVTRLPPANAARGEWALTIDDGPDPEVTPLVLDILDAHRTRATFFCIGELVQRHPQLTAQIVARGHSVQNHSHAHPHAFSLWGSRRIEAELRRAQDVLASHGVAARYFRAPAGLRNIFLAPVLQRLGLRLVAWTRRGFDTRESRPDVVLSRLEPALEGGAILLLHDGNSARNAAGRPVIADVLPKLLEAARAKGLRGVTLPEAFDTSGRTERDAGRTEGSSRASGQTDGGSSRASSRTDGAIG